MRYFLQLAYNGTRFHGWQRQPNAVSVQETIENALSTMVGKEVEIVGAGRTDAGVHAAEMFAHFDSEHVHDPEKFLSSLNKLVGRDIAVSRLLRVTSDAHARFDALSRTYHYHVCFEKNPFLFEFSHKMARIPDVELMNEACRRLLRTTDFTSFAKLHSDTKTNICKVTKAEWRKDNNGLLFEITADRFLRNMVRAVTGTLIDIGLRKISVEHLEEIIEKKDRCAAGISMPAKGLFLTRIVYPKSIFML